MKKQSLKDRFLTPWLPILHELQFNQRRTVDIGWMGDNEGGPSRVYCWVLFETVNGEINVLGQGRPDAEGNDPEIRALAHAD